MEVEVVLPDNNPYALQEKVKWPLGVGVIL
jgi:hypothetical protein